MSAQPVIVVAGLGRCGTSLVMQMLAAAGVPCVGEAPDYEDSANIDGVIDPIWFSTKAAHAMKILDPHRNKIPNVECMVIWLDRDRAQQARSQLKLLATMFPSSIDSSRAMRRQMATSLLLHRAEALCAIGQRPRVLIKFEDLVEAPQVTAWKIAHFLRPWRSLDTERMASVALPRSSACAPDMAIEVALVRKAEAA